MNDDGTFSMSDSDFVGVISTAFSGSELGDYTALGLTDDIIADVSKKLISYLLYGSTPFEYNRYAAY